MDTGPTLKEKQLAWAVAWQDHGDRTALSLLCQSVERLVKRDAGSMARGRRERFEELCAEFRLAVVEAASDFDRNRPNGFARLCGYYMQSRAFKVLQHDLSPATLPHRGTTRGQRVAIFGDDESVEVVQLMAPESYSEPSRALLHDAIDAAGLNAREWRALQRHAREESMEDLATIWGVTAARVGQIDRSARDKVRTVLQAKGLSLEDLL
jgi:hypothetical protein